MLRFVDGFDYYQTSQFLRKWDGDRNSGSTASTIAAVGRYGTNGLQQYGANDFNVFKNLTVTPQTGIMGVAVLVDSYADSTTCPGRVIFSIADPVGGGTQLCLRLETDGSLTVRPAYNSATILGSSLPGVIPAGSYRHIAWKVKVHDTTGTVEVRVDNAPVSGLVLTGQNTRRGSTNNYFTRILLGGGDGNSPIWNTTKFDDFYMCDDTGTRNNDFLGDVRVVTLYPNAAGDLAEWAYRFGAAADYLAINEHPADDDTSFLADPTVGNRFLVNLDALTALDGTVFGAAVNLVTRKDDASARSVSALVKVPSTGGVLGVATAQFIPSTYGNLQYIFEENPDTSSPFTWPEIAELQAGGKVIT